MIDAPDFSLVFSQIENKLAATKAESSRRVFHGRGKCFDGLDWLNVDYFAPVLLFTLYRPSGESTLQEAWVNTLQDKISAYFEGVKTKFNIEAVILQRRDLPESPIVTVQGGIPQQVVARRNGLRFLLNFQQQNIGYFLDIEPARAWVENHAENKRVLNLFAYTCAFSVVAAAAGASKVVNIDMSGRSLERGRNNHKMNEISCESVKFFAHDIFKSWGKLKKHGPYDVVILDPPSFQKGSFIAEKDYAKSVRRSAALLAPQGQLLACLNAPEIEVETLRQWIESAAPDLVFEERLLANQDFPESEVGRELKLLVYRLK
ncbi:MAG: class I SAM-dependent methyltransferase [Agarilytica sp.]